MVGVSSGDAVTFVVECYREVAIKQVLMEFITTKIIVKPSFSCFSIGLSERDTKAMDCCSPLVPRYERTISKC